jgi:LSD1 subclass zinc finger protein
MLCPSLKCRKLLSVPDEARGKLVKCQYCQSMLRVPAAKAEPVGAGAAPAPKPAK